MNGMPWTSAQEQALAAGWANPRLTAEDVADVLMVSVPAANQRAKKLGLKKAMSGLPPKLLRVVGDCAELWIPGDGGRVVRIDKDDCDWFLNFPGGWNAHRERRCVYVYARRSLLSKKLHRLLLDAPTGVAVDHRNRDGLDNRRSNLRLATNAQNNHNSGPRFDSKSEYKGVWLHTLSGLYCGCVKNPDGKRVSIGYYKSERDAARAHDALTKFYRGEFAFQNLPDDPMSLEEIVNQPSLHRAITASYGRLKGASNPRAVLDDHKVRELRARYTGAKGEQARLAREYGVSRSTIHDAVSGDSWSHV